MSAYKAQTALLIALLGSLVASVCYSQAIPGPADAAYGTVPGHRAVNGQNGVVFVPDPGFPRDVFAVPLNAKKALAFETDGTRTGICSRIDDKPFELNGNVKYYKFQCDRSLHDEETSPDLLFVASIDLLPGQGEKLEWQRLAGEPSLPWSGGEKPKDLHSYAAFASPRLLMGRVLVSAAWFSGQYPPAKERDELRDDLMAFGHYKLLDRTLFIGRSPTEPDTVLYKSSNLLEVRDGLDWALLPEDSSEKTRAQISAIYEIPKGYLLRVTQAHDHEGFGSDDSTYLYAYDGQWRLLASAERTTIW